MHWQQLVQQVRYSGRYATGAEAERVLRAVLTVLGGHVSSDERCELAGLLPEEAAAVISRQIPLTQPLSAPGFVDAVAARLALGRPEARWATGTVLTLLAQHAGEDLTRRILAELPRGYALLFGLAELAPAPAAAA
ncbi:DUF2267 domain-containing protein [Streptomyces sp. PKU-EA00015]|uniref:DUF2267 domain-containing protein n=1 Tax=Streptomyces sp. PKU-EA00015 TaxID=2748326 RepID=UPI0015A14472|nr:DUF2267 domain-containing protein [Streptomyces sp. PKU-EA00015]NWF25528.1 DUF2267 domain-containing protein [Streptomyces sp. PKU-EA00015]